MGKQLCLNIVRCNCIDLYGGLTTSEIDLYIIIYTIGPVGI